MPITDRHSGHLQVFDLGFGRALPSCVKNTVKAFLIAMCQPPIGALQVVQCINDFSLNGLQ